MRRRELLHGIGAGPGMRRRKFLQLIAGTAAGWPVAVHAQQRPKWRVGFLSPSSPNPFYAKTAAAFGDGISQGGLREIAEIEIVARFADNQLDRLPALAHELVEEGVRAICAAAPAAVDAALPRHCSCCGKRCRAFPRSPCSGFQRAGTDGVRPAKA